MNNSSLKLNPLNPNQTTQYGWILENGKETHRLFDRKRLKDEDGITLQDWDIRQEGFPAWATEEDKRSIVYARLAYLDCPFNNDDLKSAREILSGYGNLAQIKEKLTAYLKVNFPDTWKSHPLLNVLN